MTEILTVAKEACWLMDRFGNGVYQDVLGLCKIAYTTKEAQGEQDGVNIEDKAWSLTPGAYVGVAPVEDDGVDFHARMKEIHAELLGLQAKSNELMETISRNMEEMGI
jgi:type I restriction enzyme M protein